MKGPAVLLMVLMGSVGLAAEISVEPGAGTLSAAIASASSGDVLALSDGTYTESAAITVSKALTIRGNVADRAKTVIDCSAGVAKLFTSGAAVDFALEGLTVVNPCASVYWTKASAVTVANCTFRGVEGAASTTAGGALYIANGTGSCRIVDSDFNGCRTQNASAGALFYGGTHADGLLVERCTFTDCVTTGTSGERYGGAYRSDKRSTFRDCAFTNCICAASGGGAMFLKGSYLIEGCTFSGCQSTNTNGGVILNQASSGVITNCLFESCAAKGSGGAINATGSLSVIDSVFHDCVGTSQGGAIYTKSPLLELSGCDFIGNTGGNAGGALYLTTSTNVVMSTCRFLGNTSVDNAGTAVWFGSTALSNAVVRSSLFAGNRYTNANTKNNRGSALYLGSAAAGTEMLVENCTFADNRTARARGTDDAVVAAASTTGNWTVRNTIVWKTADDKLTATFANLKAGTNATFEHCLVNGTLEGTNNLSGDPGFVAMGVWTEGVYTQAGDYTLTEDSICKDAGLARPWMDSATDLLGNPRLAGSAVDLGAYELPQGMTFGSAVLFY